MNPSAPVDHEVINVPVLIVGGGPVGLTLAGELSRWGVANCLVEQRVEVTEHPKATLLGARSMELYRKWGIARQIIESAIDYDEDYHIVFTTKLASRELFRFTNPSLRSIEERDPDALARYPEMAWSPYVKTQIGQQTLEPILLEYVESSGVTDLRHGYEFVSYQDEGDSVLSEIVESATGKRALIRSDYVIGCDGGTSLVRKQMESSFVGRGRMRRNTSYLFRAPSMIDEVGKGLANLYFTFHPDSFGVVTAIDGVDMWNYQRYHLDDDIADLTPEQAVVNAIGKKIDIEVLAIQKWRHHQSVATRWRSGRVFLAGDSAHLMVPTGGVGMNSGIGDAWNLGWKLAAVAQGWAKESLLDSYEEERKPIAVRNSVASASNSDRLDVVMAEVPKYIDENTEEGVSARARLKRSLQHASKQFSSSGLHLGYRYAYSSVIVEDGTREPADDLMRVEQSTWPGSRTPHVWLESGESTLDLLGDGFTLLRWDDADSADRFIAAAAARSIPAVERVLTGLEARSLYSTKYTLVRPDGHVVWRSNELPDNPDELLSVCCGS